MIFLFKEQELTSTLEEYVGWLKLPIPKKPVQSTFKAVKNRVSNFLGIRKNTLIEALGGDFLRYPIDFLIDRFMTPDSYLS